MENIQGKSYGNSGNADVLKYITTLGKILDVGCGMGDNAHILKSLGYDVDGITISDSELSEAIPFLQKGYLFDLEQGLPAEVKNARYDYIICSHVLEHICYPAQLLNDIRDCLSKGGKLIVTLPNLFHYASRWKLVMGEFNYEPVGIWDDTHFRWYTFKTGKLLLEKHGFSVKVNDVTGKLPGYSVFSKLLPEKYCNLLYNGIKKISRGFFGYQLIYVATID
jgi:2-polyprenyl-3-methyl-5-hydroxy-6-metoxy-1,4-benzoquinol methylase